MRSRSASLERMRIERHHRARERQLIVQVDRRGDRHLVVGDAAQREPRQRDVETEQRSLDVPRRAVADLFLRQRPRDEVAAHAGRPDEAEVVPLRDVAAEQRRPFRIAERRRVDEREQRVGDLRGVIARQRRVESRRRDLFADALQARMLGAEPVDAVIEPFPGERRRVRFRGPAGERLQQPRFVRGLRRRPLIGLDERRQRVEQRRDHPLRDRAKRPRLARGVRQADRSRRPATAAASRRPPHRFPVSVARARGWRARIETPRRRFARRGPTARRSIGARLRRCARRHAAT